MSSWYVFLHGTNGGEVRGTTISYDGTRWRALQYQLLDSQELCQNLLVEKDVLTEMSRSARVFTISHHVFVAVGPQTFWQRKTPKLTHIELPHETGEVVMLEVSW